ncbi:kinase-like domain-containing protein [Syncephalis fuscata]|nr:kinase-like domain-containing protein [Syncephalis fuscata]
MIVAVHSLTGHRVAIKLVSRRRVKDQDLGERVRREIRHLQRLQHPHIIKLYEVITTPTDIIMVMEYAGGELFDYISSRSRLNEAEARRFFQQIISALGYCHREKIVHRDLKPENLLLDDRDNIKIADFGLSNMLTDGEFLKTSCGSPNYAAPEVITGKLYAGPEVDVWSCGVILYVMLCGQLPFDHDHIPTLFRKITEGRYSVPGYISSSARDLLKRMLIVDPLQRITIEEIWQHEWFCQDLPDYLSLTESISRSDSEHTAVDEEVLDELQEKLGISACEMRTALTEPRTNPVKVAYQLSMDKRRSFEDDLLSSSDMSIGSNRPRRSRAASLTSQSVWTGSPINTMSTHLTATSGTAMTSKSASPPTPSSIQVLSSSLPIPQEDPYQSRASRFVAGWRRHIRSVSSPQSNQTSASTAAPLMNTNIERHPSSKLGIMGLHPSSNQRSANTSHQSTHGTKATHGNSAMSGGESGSRRRSSVRPRWHFGIRSQGRPIEVMDEVYRALSNIGMEWKVIDPFHLRARFIGPQGLLVKLDLQLYTMDNHLYLLDFCQVQPPTSTSSISPSMSPIFSKVMTSSLMAHSFDDQHHHHHRHGSHSSSNDSQYSDNTAATVDDMTLPTIVTTTATTTTTNAVPHATAMTATSMAKGLFIGQSPFPFFDVCSRLITELALSS